MIHQRPAQISDFASYRITCYLLLLADTAADVAAFIVDSVISP